MSEHVHVQRFDGDDPYLVCDCGARWDAITGVLMLPTAADLRGLTKAPTPPDALRVALRMLAGEPEAEYRATDATGNTTFEWRGITKGQAEAILRAVLAESQSAPYRIVGSDPHHEPYPPERGGGRVIPDTVRAAYPEFAAPLERYSARDCQFCGRLLLDAGWEQWHPRECSNQHDEGGNCLDSGGSIVGWREAAR